MEWMGPWGKDAVQCKAKLQDCGADVSEEYQLQNKEEGDKLPGQVEPWSTHFMGRVRCSRNARHELASSSQ